ncbi:MAG: murein L,D-transpeptidase [Gammaproteobacteria bacterium]|nr:MAG: murein L,D-transpeptidase [Gammaproteobacteria bacterium]
MMMHFKSPVIAFLLFLWLLPVTVIADETFQTEVESRIESSVENARYLKIGEQVIYTQIAINEVYQSNGYQPIWNQKLIAILKKELLKLKDDGLNPDEYWFPSINTLLNKQQQEHLDISSSAELDILLSEAFFRAYYNLRIGKVDPEALDKNFNFAQPLDKKNIRPQLIVLLKEGQITEALEQARPAHKRYDALKNVLAHYREYQNAGGWEAIKSGETLRLGDKNTRVSHVRSRLIVTGDYLDVTEDSELFDAELESAVKHFQERHELDNDGVIGAKTLAEMNVTVEQRIDQLRVNLERQRWYLDELQGEFIVVDIAGFHIYWMKDDKLFWEAKSQVGKQFTQTPVFKDAIRYIDFNPTWTIPAGIKRRSILPNLKKDPEYLVKKGYLLLTMDGKEVDSTSIDWASMSHIPYMVRQPAGPDNALGLVKFMFPNKHAVYLHDTNYKDYFLRTSRSFSAGCVRVDKPFELAEKLLADQDGWNRKKIDEVIASGKTTRVNLKKPIKIVIGYSTVLRRNGDVFFREDVYNRDSKLLKALNGPFKIRAQDR